MRPCVLKALLSLWLYYFHGNLLYNVIRTVASCVHFNVECVRIGVFSSERAEEGRIHFFPFVVASLRRAALQCEVPLCRLYECVLAQAVEGVLEAVQGADMRVSVEPACGRCENKMLTGMHKPGTIFGSIQQTSQDVRLIIGVPVILNDICSDNV